MRIITGTARGTRLETLAGEATRPTQERIKEAVFSMIQFDLEGRRVLDLFAGSGQMGLEALSRGAGTALLCDSGIDAVDIIKRNAQKTKLWNRCRVLRSDAQALIRSLARREQFDIIFVDPPYTDKSVGDILGKLHRAEIPAPGSVVITECDMRDPVDAAGYIIRRHNRYGRVYITVYDYVGDKTEGAEVIGE